MDVRGMTAKEVVKWYLENEIEARDDDDLLVALVSRAYYPASESVDFYTITRNRTRFGIPSPEVITRLRRKIQEQYPGLVGCEPIVRRRMKKEKEWREEMRKKNEK